jgi:hypothetical protein
VLIPAGVYALHAPLLGHCSNANLQPGDPLKGHKSICGAGETWPDVGHPLRIIGEGVGITVLVAAVPIEAVLHWRSSNNRTAPDIFSDQKGKIHRVDPDFGSTLTASSRDYQSNYWVNWKIMGQPCEFQVQNSVEHLTISGNCTTNATSNVCSGGAQYGIVGASIIHSRVVSVHVSGCSTTRIRLTNSFCDQVQNCRFNSNGVGVEFKGAVNNVDIVDNWFEGGDGIGIQVTDGAQVLIQGNVIEGESGPGIVTSAVRGLDIRSNYFESNSERYGRPPKGGGYGIPFTMPHGEKVCFDVLINGAAGNDDISHLATNFPAAGVNIGGNYHNPLTSESARSFAPCRSNEWSAYVIASAIGVTVTGNACSRKGCEPGKNISLLSVGGVDPKLWSASKVRVESNGGWEGSHALRLRMGNSSSATVPAMAFHTFSADCKPSFPLSQILRSSLIENG